MFQILLHVSVSYVFFIPFLNFIYLFLEMYTFTVDTLSTFFALHFECEVFSVMEYRFIYFFTLYLYKYFNILRTFSYMLV